MYAFSLLKKKTLLLSAPKEKISNRQHNIPTECHLFKVFS